MPYIHFTKEQKEQAASVDLEEFLRLRGEALIHSGHDKRLQSDHSVTIRGNEWFDHATQKGGGPISFVQTHYNLTYPEAVTLLLGGEQGPTFPSVKEQITVPSNPFELPPKNSDMRRVFAYLMKQRHIDRDVISYFAKAGLLYEDAQYHNCVFIGTDENGVAHHAHKRSTNTYGQSFRANVESSDPRYSFHHVGTSGWLYVFEAPIDMLSFISLCKTDWEQNSYVALCGTSGIPVRWLLEQYPYHQEQVVFCLDNDRAGQAATNRLRAELQEGGHPSGVLLPVYKDWNDDLVAQFKQEEVSVQCPTMSGI